MFTTAKYEKYKQMRSFHFQCMTYLTLKIKSSTKQDSHLICVHVHYISHAE